MQQAPFFIPRAGLIRVEEIDREHQAVVDALETVRLHLECDSEANLRKTLEVGDLLRSHFRDEEKLMGEYGYPNLAQHTVHHDRTLGTVFRILGNVEIAGVVTLEDLRDIYRTLIDDIFAADVAFSNFLLAQGFLRSD